MDQTRAINALAPFIALAKSATSPRAAADLINQATSAPNTYVFAELLQQPNIQALARHEQFGSSYELLKLFSWGTWADYKASSNLPELNPQQTQKLRLLSLLTIASQTHSSANTTSNLSYPSLQSSLSLPTPLLLEQLLTTAIYNDLLTATLNPASQTVIITSVAPLRDLAPGSIATQIAELEAWSGRCDSVLAELEAEISKVKEEAKKRNAREVKAKRQFEAFVEAQEKSAGDGRAGGGSGGAGGKSLRSNRGPQQRSLYEEEEEEEEEDDMMDVDGGNLGAGGGKKRSGGGVSSIFSKMKGARS